MLCSEFGGGVGGERKGRKKGEKEREEKGKGSVLVYVSIL